MSNAKIFQEWAKEILPIVQAAAYGDDIEMCNPANENWVPAFLEHGIIRGYKYRVKPKTIRIGKYDVPEPMRDVPVPGTKYYAINPLPKILYSVASWDNTHTELEWLRQGILHRTKEAAIFHTMALLSLTEVEYVHPS